MLDSNSNDYTALPSSGRGPGVLVLHAWWGLTDFIRRLCDRLAAEGYVALAPDLFGGKTAKTVAEAEKLIGEFEGEAAGGAALAALERLTHLPATEGRRTAVIGFSFGAYYALWLANHRPTDLAAVVIFYGSGEPDFQNMQAACQGHFAEHDPFEPPEGVQYLEQKLHEAGREVTFHTYPGTGHWFFEADRPDAYDPEASELAWSRTLEFLQSELKTGD